MSLDSIFQLKSKKVLISMQAKIKSKSPKKLKFKELKVKVYETLNSKSSTDNLTEILDLLKECLQTNTSVTSSILAVELLFTTLFAKKDTIQNPGLYEKYTETLTLLLDCFEHESPTESQQALASSMKLIASESGLQNKERFPIASYRLVLAKLLSAERSNTHLFSRFSEFGQHLDVVFHTWTFLPNLIAKVTPTVVFTQNLLELINVVPVPKELDEDSTTFLCPTSSITNFDYKKVRKCLNKTWQILALWEHNEETQTQTLVVLLDKILPHLENPELLTDFLMDSLDVEGPVCLLALQGIFILIQQHNLTYPNIYEKIYSLFKPNIFATKYKSRLFVLADIFLSSSHLPEKLIAAFVKRLARLALIAPTTDVVVICQFIGNLILRHPGLKFLIDSDRTEEVADDPYNPDERDPYKANAQASFLWEIQSLQNHVCPAVATAARFMSHPLPKIEWDLQAVLEVTENEMFQKEIAKNTKGIVLSLQDSSSADNSQTVDRTFHQFWDFK